MASPFRKILGIRFFTGELEELLDRTPGAGLIVVPSAPVLVDLDGDPAHRAALLASDFAITDSGFFVMLWWLVRGERLPRISGLRYLRGLLGRASFRAPGATFWIMPSAEDDRANRAWLRAEGIVVDDDDSVVAPLYPPGPLADAALLRRIQARRPVYVMINLGGGVQERLGHYLRRNLGYTPALICTGAAIAFLTGRQASIPVWADRMVLGWFLRLAGGPRRFLPRYLKALRLPQLVIEESEAGAGVVI